MSRGASFSLYKGMFDIYFVIFFVVIKALTAGFFDEIEYNNHNTESKINKKSVTNTKMKKARNLKNEVQITWSPKQKMAGKVENKYLNEIQKQEPLT